MSYREAMGEMWIRPGDVDALRHRVRELEAENVALRVENERVRSLLFRLRKVCARACQGAEEVWDEHAG
jgi:regulator of replication initiation timing